MTPLDRAIGTLLGLACGDAVGTTLEFRARGTFEKINDMVGGGPFRLKIGEWTGDTSRRCAWAEFVVHRWAFAIFAGSCGDRVVGATDIRRDAEMEAQYLFRDVTAYLPMAARNPVQYDNY